MDHNAVKDTEPERLHRNVWVASGTSFLTDVSSEMILNVLPLFLANVLGVRVWAVGVVEGLADATASVVKLYSGRLSDRMRARKWLAVCGYTISALAKPFYLVANTWGAVAGVRWGDRVGKGVRTAPRDALLADSSPSGRHGLVFGLHRAADTAGAVIGLLLALWVVGRLQGSGALLEEETFRRLVLWSLIPAFLAVLLLAFGARDVTARRARAAAPTLRLRGLGRGFGAFVAASVLFELGNSADAFLVLRAQERGLSVADVLWVLLAFNVVYAVVAVPAGSLADRVPRKWIVFGSWCVYAVSYLGFAFARTAWQVTALYMLYAVYYGMVAGAAKALIAELVPAEMRGLAYGGYAAAIGLVSLPASVLAGVLWEGLGDWNGFGGAAPFAFGAATAGLAAILLIVTVPTTGRSSGLGRRARVERPG
jgi:MFS family permease